MTQYAAGGRLGYHPARWWSGWICIRAIEIPANQGKLPRYGECVAVAQDMPTAKIMAASPDMADALLIAAVALQDAIDVAKRTGGTLSETSAVAALAVVNAALDQIA